jgi:3',5'-cyclic AMP phosphodiesterase CpdA
MTRFFCSLALLLALLPVQGAPRPAARPMRAIVPAAAQAFRFIAYGDTRSHPDDHRKVITRIVALHPEFVLQTGDLVANGRSRAQWDEFDAIVKPLKTAHIAYYPARGNHDMGPYYVDRVTQPFDSGNKYYYAFTRHGNRFIILDNFEDFDTDSAQYRWLETELKKARKSAVNTFVAFHEAPFSVGPHGPSPAVVQFLHPLFVKYRPRVVFCGHDHLYYRTVRDGVTYIVTGGGGAELYAPTNRDLAIPGDVFERVHHVVLCEVNGAQVTMTAITSDGKVIDKLTVGP